MIRVQEEDFDVGAELAALSDGRHNIGGVVSFTGLVRDLGGEQAVQAMTLEHYPGMTEKMLSEIEAEAQKRWPELPVHLSTMAEVTNSAAVAFYERLGVRRITLPRHLALGEPRTRTEALRDEARQHCRGPLPGTCQRVLVATRRETAKPAAVGHSVT